MEIYQESTLGTDPTTSTPAKRDGVMFASSTGRTPLQLRSGRKPLGAHNYQRTPHTGSSKNITHSGLAQNPSGASLKTSSRVGFEKTSPSMASNGTTGSKPKQSDKENSVVGSPMFFTSTLSPPLTLHSSKSTDSNTTTPNSAQAFRRALRGQSKSNGTNTTSSSHRFGVGGSALGPPLRMAPKTPTSILRTEFESPGDIDGEESLLVSPSGAFLSVLEASQRAPSSTGLLVVPPKTAETIHRITTAQKERRRFQEQGESILPQPAVIQPSTWKSPTAHVGKNLEAPVSTSKMTPRLSERRNNHEASRTPPKVTSSGKGVAIDLSSMFSNEKVGRASKPQSFETTKKQSPKLMQAGALSSTPKEKNESIFWSLEVQHENGQVNVSVSKASPSTQAPSSTKSGVVLDMSDMFSTNNPQPNKALSPPPHLLKRLQQPMHRRKPGEKKKDVKQESEASKNTLSKQTNALEKENNNARSLQSAARRQGNSTKQSELSNTLERKGPGMTTTLDDSAETRLAHRNEPAIEKTSKYGKTRTTETRNRDSKVDNQVESREVYQREVHKKPWKTKSMSPGAKKASSPMPVRSRVNVGTPRSKLNGNLKGKKVKSPLKVLLAPGDWASQQCDTFQHWLNYTFHPTEDEESASDASKQSGLRALVIHRRLAQVRYRATELFQTVEMRRVRTVVQNEIAKGKLTIRSDRDIHADLSLRKLAVKLLLSYTTPWLRLGLEVMFGECIMPEDLKDSSDVQVTPVARMRATLKAFVVDRVLSDRSVLMKYTKGRTKVPSGKFEKLYKEEMRTLVLYRMMVLILFLDRAKMNNVVDTAPRLFSKGSDVKSSKAVLLSFCRNFLSAEGDFIKHLSRIGLQVSYVQDPIDELEFEISNLAADLRDGSRLTRLTEILTHASFKSSMRGLRLPAVSRLQKMHNVNLAFSKLVSHNIHIPKDINAHHIVDAHREMVLKLMWALVAHTCVERLLEGGHVEQEIENVQRSNLARRKVQGLGVQSQKWISPLKEEAKRSSSEQVLKILLLRWCQAVCTNFGIEMENFTTSFADGRALCYLVHYYHPGIIKEDEILPTGAEEDSTLSPEEAIRNQRSNSLMVARRITDLGGIPRMLPISDCGNPPDEKSMLLCLTYLCSRLMESSKEIFATILIQASYRRYREKVLREKKEKAATLIFSFWCRYKHQYFANRRKKFVAAVQVLETFVLRNQRALKKMKVIRLARERQESACLLLQRLFRGHKARVIYWDKLRKFEAAVTIQKYFRGFRAQLQWFEMMIEMECATKIQSVWRSYCSRTTLEEKQIAATVIQKVRRGQIIRRFVKEQHVAAMRIQAAWWAWVDFADSQVAAILIQSQWRGKIARTLLADNRKRILAATSIQRVWRGYFDTTMYELKRESAISIQKLVRGSLARTRGSMRIQRDAAVVIQKIVRGFSVQVQYQIALMDIITVQSVFRRRKAVDETSTRIKAIEALQCAFRCAIARRIVMSRRLQRHRENKRLQATIICQTFFRQIQARQELFVLKQRFLSSMTIQSSWRRFSCRRSYLDQRRACIAIQSRWRCSTAQVVWQDTRRRILLIQSTIRAFLAFRMRYRAATRIQSAWRGQVMQKKYECDIAAIIIIQKCVRGCFARVRWHDTVHSVVKIQAAWRCFWAKYNYELDMLEVIICQSVVRRVLAKREANMRSEAIQTLQNFVRVRLAVKKTNSLRWSLAEKIARNQASTKIQSLWRQHDAVKACNNRKASIIRLQSFVRMWLYTRMFQRQRKACAVIQGLFRGQQCRLFQSKCSDMATRVQATWRRYFFHSRYEQQRGSAILLQSIVRTSLARTLLARKVDAILKVQAVARRKLAVVVSTQMRRKILQEIEENRAATLFQTVFRGRMAKMRYVSKKGLVTKIQAFYRGRRARIEYELDCFDVRLCQSTARRWLARRKTTQRINAIIVIQCMMRRAVASRKTSRLRIERETHEIQSFATSVLQAYYRGYLVRRNMKALHHYASRIQSAFRSHVAYVTYQLVVADIKIVQTLTRRWLARKRVVRMQENALKIQTVFRRKLAMHRVQQLRTLKKKQDAETLGAVIIQKEWRRCVARLTVQKLAAARRIQKTWRCFAAHVDFLLKQIMAIRLQARVRSFLVRNRFLRMKVGVIRLQAMCRGVESRFQVKMFHMAATVVQAAYRRFSARSSFFRVKKAATTIQRVTRGLLVRDEIELSHFAATEIQRSWRGFVQFCDYVIALDAAVKVQSFFRMSRAINEYQAKRLHVYIEHCYEAKTARKIQRAFRHHLHLRRLHSAACTIQRLGRSYVIHRRATVVSRGVVALQAAFRAKKVRRRRSKKISNLARRVKIANTKARQNPKMKIGYKTRYALQILQTSNSLAEIMDAVKSLEISTRLSQLCCVLFTEADAARILLDLIRSCNRSIPHVELVHCILLTLDNVARYDQLVYSFADCNSAEIFLDKMQMFRDKDGIFCLTISLLGKIARHNSMVEEFCAMHEHLKRLKALHGLALKRSKTSEQAARSKKQVSNRMKRREYFDRHLAIKQLGSMVNGFTTVNATQLSKSRTGDPKKLQFTFDH